MNPILRSLLLFTGAVMMILTVGFFIQAPWAAAIWPFQASRLSYIFLSSIFAASGAPILWIALSGETRALVGGAINLALMNTAWAVFTTQLYLRDHTQPLLRFAVAVALVAAFCAGLYIYARRFPWRDARPTPPVVRISFGVFAVVLLLAGGALVLQRPNIFPWPISPEASVYYGWIFLGAMCYFIYGLLRPHWANARGQLLGFLAYDLVLIVPFLAHFQNVRPDLRASLTLYTGVLVISGVEAIYYLLIHRATRFHLPRKGKASQPVPEARSG